MLRQERSHAPGESGTDRARSPVPDVRDLDDTEVVPLEQLAQRRLVVPGDVSFVYSGPTANAVHEDRHRERIRSRHDQQPVRAEMATCRVEERAGAREVLDNLTRPDNVERTPEIHRLRVTDENVEALRPSEQRQYFVDVDTHDLPRDRTDLRVYPVGAVDAGTRTDIEHRAALEVAADTGEAFAMAARAPVGLQRMTRRHPDKRRTLRAGGRLGAAAIAAMMAAACSSSRSSNAVAPSTTSSIVITPTSSTTSPAQGAGVVPIDGRGDRLVDVPVGVALPAIVHARYTGPGGLTIESVYARGRAIPIVTSPGAYDGTFPLGFIAPVTGMHVKAAGPWHLDVANASLAPEFSTGIAGHGDAVLTYTGAKADKLVTHSGRSRFILRIYSNEGPHVLVDDTAPRTEKTTLPAGPAFVSVTAPGPWSIAPA